MALFAVDVEADGKAPGETLYSMVSFGIVRVDDTLTERFEGKCAPISTQWVPEALAVSGFTRAQHLTFEDPKIVMARANEWVKKANGDAKVNGRPTFISDNPAFDWLFMHWYFVRFVGDSPFGHSARRVGDFCAGVHRDWSATRQYKSLAKQKHTHNPVEDALQVAQGLIALAHQEHIVIPGVGSTLVYKKSKSAPGRTAPK